VTRSTLSIAYLEKVTMASNGIMEEIRSLLTQDKSSAEVIALGFKPSTVYKTQRQLKRQAMPINMAQVLVTNVDPQVCSAPEVGNVQVKSLRGQVPEVSLLIEELAQAVDRTAEIEFKPGEVWALRERVADLESEARAADEWKRKYHELEDRLSRIDAALGQDIQDWQNRFAAEEMARNEAEALSAGHREEADCLREVNQKLRQKVASMPNLLAQEIWELVQPLEAELEELRTLHSEVNRSPGSPSGKWPVRVIRERRFGKTASAFR